MQVRGQSIITAPSSPDPPYHHYPLLSHLTEQWLMIINTLKHLRSTGSERTPERERDERKGGGGRGRQRYGNDVLARMICRIDFTNHHWDTHSHFN